MKIMYRDQWGNIATVTQSITGKSFLLSIKTAAGIIWLQRRRKTFPAVMAALDRYSAGLETWKAI